MIKLSFKRVQDSPITNLRCYDSVSRIPFSLRFGDESNFPTTIYARNFHGGNFIEFRFDKEIGNLYEITLVSIQNDSVRLIVSNDTSTLEDKFYRCFIESTESNELMDSVQMEVLKGLDSISINWGNQQLNQYLRISKNCLLGIDDRDILVSVKLIHLDKNQVYGIFGF